MTETRNIVVLGASFAGLQTTHYIAKFILPQLKTAHKGAHYQLYVINPSSDIYFRTASPRVAASTTLLPTEKVFAPLSRAFKNYKEEDFTWIQGTATGLDATSRVVKYQRKDGKDEEQLQYHALIVATGSKTHYPAFSTWDDKDDTLAAIKATNAAAAAAKSIVIVGGGATGVEFAGEVSEFLNGRPGWFSTPPRKVAVTLLTSAERLLTTLRPVIGEEAEQKLKDRGVEVRYNTRVTDTHEEQDGKTTLTLADGQKITTDLYIPAHGVLPNSSWLPSNLLTDNKYLKTNTQTLRVDLAGPRVYAIGDISSYSRNTILDIIDGLPVLFTNLKRDLFSYRSEHPDSPAPGKDRIFVQTTKEMMVVPIGRATGVGAVLGWKVPGWVAWLIKGRDYLLSMSYDPITTGSGVKDIKWTKEEMVTA